jgi:methyltransferase-like protein
MGANLPAELFRSFGDSALDWYEREQISDFIRGRAFRNAVLCRDGIACARTPSAEALRSLRIGSLVRPATTTAAGRPEGGVDFYNLRGEFALSTNDPLIKTALVILDEVRPRSVPFETLWAQVQERQGALAPAADPGDHPGASPERLAELLLDNFTHNIIELHVREPEYTTEVREFPRACPSARLNATVSSRVANRRHRMIALVDFDQFVLPHLDGRHDRRVLLQKMKDAIKAGDVAVQSQGSPVTEPTAAEPLLARLLEQSLERLAAGALLVG